MKNSDLLLLSMLRQDARQTLTEMSRKTRIPISTLYDRLRTQEQNLILKHTTLVDFSKLGYYCRAKIMLTGIKEEREKLRAYLCEHPSTNSLFKINNGYDFLSESVFHNVKEMEDFLEHLESLFSIAEKKIFFVIDDLRRECFLSRPEHLALLRAKEA